MPHRTPRPDSDSPRRKPIPGSPPLFDDAAHRDDTSGPLEGQDLIPDLDAVLGPYRITFARTNADLEAARRLRYAVFNVEMGEGLVGAHETGLDADAFDRHCQHLLVTSTESGAVVGTYRMQTQASAMAGHGWYTAGEFELDTIPSERFDSAGELGRACVARAHRDKRVLFLLWHGLIRYAQHNGIEAYFGCSSLTGTDPKKGVEFYAHMVETGCVHEELYVAPRESMACPLLDWPLRKGGVAPTPEVPKLFASYLRHGAKVLGPPAIDHEFGTIDFLTWVDVTPRHIARFGRLR